MTVEERANVSSRPVAGTGSPVRLIVLSFLMLFVELGLIRWSSSYVVYLAFFTNFVLLASFLGVGVGFLVRGLPAICPGGHPSRLPSSCCSSRSSPWRAVVWPGSNDPILLVDLEDLPSVSIGLGGSTPPGRLETGVVPFSVA